MTPARARASWLVLDLNRHMIAGVRTCPTSHSPDPTIQQNPHFAEALGAGVRALEEQMTTALFNSPHRTFAALAIPARMGR
jgi:hypothetical protein